MRRHVEAKSRHQNVRCYLVKSSFRIHFRHRDLGDHCELAECTATHEVKDGLSAGGEARCPVGHDTFACDSKPNPLLDNGLCANIHTLGSSDLAAKVRFWIHAELDEKAAHEHTASLL